MPINVSEALDNDTSERVRIIRQTKGGYVDGIFVESKEIFVKALASVQPATADQLKTVPEGERSTDTKALFINKRVYTSGKNGQVADLIKFKDERYKVVSVGDWSSYGFNIAMGIKL